MARIVERRSNPRNSVSALVCVRLAESGLARMERRCPVSNLSSNSLYLLVDGFTLRQPMRLALSFVTDPDSSAVNREYLVEVVRQQPFFPGYSGVAAKLLENVRWRLHDGILMPETGLFGRSPLVTPAHIDIRA